MRFLSRSALARLSRSRRLASPSSYAMSALRKAACVLCSSIHSDLEQGVTDAFPFAVGLGQALPQSEACLTVFIRDERFEEGRLCFVLQHTIGSGLSVACTRNGRRGISLCNWWRPHGVAIPRAGLNLPLESAPHGGGSPPVVSCRGPLSCSSLKS